MFNVEQEYEIAGNGNPVDYWVPKATSETREFSGETYQLFHIYRHGSHYDSWYFHATTGIHRGNEGNENPMRLRPKSATRPTNHYDIWAGQRAWEKDQWVKTRERYSDGRTAAERSKTHNGFASSSLSPFRFMVKKEVELSPVRDYPQWAAFRFGTGEWAKLPWADEPWAANEATAHHFAHVGIVDDCQVAYYASEADAQNDQCSTMAPGRYLTQFYGDVLSPNEVRDWAVKLDVECELHFAYTSEEIVKVYTSKGPDSCMQYADDYGGWSCGMNPTVVYGAGDIALAYLTRKNKIVARGLVWPEKKAVGRLYGDIERMTERLTAEGFEFDCSSHNVNSRGKGLFNGARVKLIRPERHPNNVMMPYLDYGYRINKLDDETCTLSMADGYLSHRTDGLAFDPRSIPTEFHPEGATPTGEVYDCSEDDEFQCWACEQDYDLDDRYVGPDDRSYCDDCFSDRFSTCGRCGATQSDDNITYINDTPHCGGCYDTVGFYCEYCEEHEYSHNQNTVHDGRYDDPSDAEHHSSACDYCVEEDDRIQRDVNGLLVDTTTTDECDNDHHYNQNLDECPHAECVAERAAEEDQELETA